MTRFDLARLLGAPAGLVAEARPGPVVIAEGDPRRFMAALATATAQGGVVMLAGDTWGESERAQLNRLLETPGSALPAPGFPQGWLCIPTGGTGGRLKFARHDEETLSAAVRGFCAHFRMTRVNAAGLLPLHHVSGLMAWLRCALTGGEYRHLDWKKVEAGELPPLPAKPEGWVISLVPTQLERLLRFKSGRTGSPDPVPDGGRDQPAEVGRVIPNAPKHPAIADDQFYHGSPVDWLRQFRTIFLGGAPAWPELLAQAAEARLPLSPGYGMTETAAMVTALSPEEFLAGTRGSGRMLPHARVTVDGDGVISVGGDSLFRGYYPEWRERTDLVSGDLGHLDAAGHLHVRGRRDAIIITGGEKVDPAEVESVLRECGEFADIVVLGVPDQEWGQVVIAVHPADTSPDGTKVAEWIRTRLPAHQRPKRFVALAEWPVNEQGKVDRVRLQEQIGKLR